MNDNLIKQNNVVAKQENVKANLFSYFFSVIDYFLFEGKLPIENRLVGNRDL